MKAATEPILCERRDSYVIVTINREDDNNTLNRAALRQLTEVFASLRSDDGARAVILTGAGDWAFSAGADVEECLTFTPEQATELLRAWQSIALLIEDLGKPVIAAINGSADGRGCDLASACALRLATVEAEFSFPLASLGLISMATRLSRLIGESRAMEMALTGEPLGAEEAWRIGLVNRLARDRNELMTMCEELATKIVCHAPLAVEYAMKAVKHATTISLEEGLRLESKLFGLCFAAEDAREGAEAFLEKRPPNFKGR